MSGIVRKVIRKKARVSFCYFKQKLWCRHLSAKLLGKGFHGISIGDTNGNFFRPGWRTVDLLNADVVCDMRKNGLPFEDNSLDAAHASHLVEHISDPKQLFCEVHRCLKPGGIFRLSTPDLDLLISKCHENDWRWFLGADGPFILERVIEGRLPPESLMIHNRLVGWLASYSGRLDTAGGPVIEKELVDEKLGFLSKYEFRDWCVSLLESDRVHAHVHVYDYEELDSVLRSYGFSEVVRKESGNQIVHK